MDLIDNTKRYICDKNQDILFGAGVAGIGFTLISSVRAGIKIKQAKDEYDANVRQIEETVRWRENGEIDPETPYTKEDEEIDRKNAKKSYITSVSKAVVVPIATATASAACFGVSTGISNVKLAKQTAIAESAILTANKLSDFIKKYRGRVRDELGEVKDLHFAIGLPEGTATVEEVGEDGKKKKVKKTVLDVKSKEDLKDLDLSPYQLIWGPYKLNGQPNHNFHDNKNLDMMFLSAIEGNCESYLQRMGYCRLSYVYEELGEMKSGIGTLGWIKKFQDESVNPKFGNMRDGRVMFRIKPIDVGGGAMTVYLLDFNCDGVIENLIDEASIQNAKEIGVRMKR